MHGMYPPMSCHVGGKGRFLVKIFVSTLLVYWNWNWNRLLCL